MAESLRKILVIGVARIGDTLLLSPVLRALKGVFPKAELTVLAHPKRQEILDHLPFVDRLASITKGRAAWRGHLPGKTYDAALVYGRDRALVAYARRVSRRVVCFDEPAFARFSGPGLTKVARPAGSIHAVHERLLLVRALGVEAEDHRLAYVVTAAEREQARNWLAVAGGGDRHPLIGLQLFSFPTKAHRDWPVDNFIAVVRGVLEHHPDARFVVLGDAQAASAGASLAALFPGRVLVAAGRFSLRQSAALMSLLDLYLGVDTGPTHVAGALGIAMIALYHHQYPGRNLAPLQNSACHVIEHPATLRPESATAGGMEAIAADEITRLALAILEGASAERSAAPPRSFLQ